MAVLIILPLILQTVINFRNCLLEDEGCAVVAWCSCQHVVSDHLVALRWARLVLGWVLIDCLSLDR